MKMVVSGKVNNILLSIGRFARQACKFIRTQKLITRVFGPQYRRNNNSIDIDITYACNLRCFSCHRSCTQAPSDEHISIGQIKRFVEESKSNNIRWNKIKIVGGEPTLHPQIFEIVNLLINYKKEFSPKTKISITTNGCGKKVNEVLSKLPKKIVIRNTRKTRSMQPEFYAFNVAPIDSRIHKNIDYSNACKITSRCGIGLTPYGYYPCAIAGGIDRIFGFDLGRKELPPSNDLMQDQLRVFCRLYGLFTRHRSKDPKKMSSTWKKAYERYRSKRPLLTRYGALG